MQTGRVDSQGVGIAYDIAGDGAPIVLVHGFAADRVRNWKDPRWYDTLTGAGRRVVALDCRGHGASDKPHDPAAYAIERMAGDVIRVMDHLRIERADLMGYSMGGRIALALLAHHAERFATGVLGGVGPGVAEVRQGDEGIARALEADDASGITHPVARIFRAFAEQGGNDLKALAACIRGLQRTSAPNELAQITQPVLIVVGSRDDLVGDPAALAAQLPTAEALIIPDRDHLSTVGDRRFKQAVLDFLATHA